MTYAVVNHAQLVGTQDGKVIVPTYDWATFFDQPLRQRALKDIKSMHHLTLTSTKTWPCGLRTASMAWKERSSLYRMTIGHLQPIAYLPPYHPLGCHLNVGNIYLKTFENFCPVECQDLVCPDPVKENTPPTPRH